MKTKKVLITTGGVLFLLFGTLHLYFWKLFDWNHTLKKLSQVNRNVMQLLNIGLIVLLFSLGLILLIFRKALMTTNLGRAIFFASSVFFFVRFHIDFVLPGGSIIL